PRCKVSLAADSLLIPGMDAREIRCLRRTSDRDAGPATRALRPGQRGTMTIEIRRIARQLSPSLTASAAALFACGALCGWFMYLGRSPIREKYIPGTPAYWQHLLLAALAGVLFGYARWRHRHRFGPRSARLWLLAPPGPAAPPRAARATHRAP